MKVEIKDKLKLLRNHGLVDRDNIKLLGYNSRLDTIQAVVGNWILPQAKKISTQRLMLYWSVSIVIL